MFTKSSLILLNSKGLNVRVIIVTQEEPFYLPVFLGKVLEKFKTVVAVTILPGTPQGFTRLSHIKRLFDVFGLRIFLTYGALFAYYKFLNLLSRVINLGRFYSVKCAAQRNSVPVYKTKNVNDPKFLDVLRALEPDVIVSVASPQVFKRDIINLSKHAINIHAALLPKYRGMMPRFWVLAKGEKETGVTVHYIDQNIDTGNIILQKTIDIAPQETLHSLQKKIANVGTLVLLEALEKIERGDSVGTPPLGEGSYYSFPTREAAREFRSRGRRFI